jgi:hypothetical protein
VPQPFTGADVRGLQALLALLHLELDTLVFRQRFKAVALDIAEMREEIGAARVLGDEAVALRLVEPLHGAGLRRHGRFSYLSIWYKKQCASGCLRIPVMYLIRPGRQALHDDAVAARAAESTQ